jgi:hypothetical protein
MNTPTKVVGFAVVLAVVFGLALGAGNLFGSEAADPEPAAHDTTHGDTEDTHDTGSAAPAADVPGGLMVSQGGYTLELADPVPGAGEDVPVRFTISGPDGRPVSSYEVEHEKRLHLIAVRRDASGFQHVHPELADDGSWATTLDLTAGQWRLFADFRPTGHDGLTLGADLAVAGNYRLTSPAVETRTAVVDGYTVRLDGDLAAGEDARLTLSVERDGRPVTDLQPYLGAYGHLVALREGDLAYLHVHPDGSPGDGSTEPGPDVVFYAEVPSVGRYHVFMDFKHGGVVRTAAFTVSTPGHDGGEAAAPSKTPEPSEQADDHGHSDTDDH